MQNYTAWSPQAFQASKVLRDVSEAPSSDRQVVSCPPARLLDSLAATIAFRQVCWALQSRGCVWIAGVPSYLGRSLLRALLPDAIFHVVDTETSKLFVVAHATSSPSVWRRELSSVFAGVLSAVSPRVLPLRTSLFYRTRSLG